MVQEAADKARNASEAAREETDLLTEEKEQEILRKYIRDVATLRRLTLSDERVEQLIPVVKEYLAVDRLDELDYTGVELATVFQLKPMKRS